MSNPTPVVRAATYERDGHRCVSCGRSSGLQYQHRRAEGMGGRKARPTFAEGLTSCATCNPAYEGYLQASALRHGWKVRSWVVDQGRAHEVPVFYAPERTWFRVTDAGERVKVPPLYAEAMMSAVYGDEYYEWKAKVA